MRNELTEELARVEGGPLHKKLIEKRNETVSMWTASTSSERDLILKGEKRVYDSLIAEIESARDSFKNQPRSDIKSSDRF